MNRRKAAAIERERRTRRRRRRIVVGSLLAVALIGLLIYAKTGGNKKTTVATATTTSTSTTAAALPSVAGKPCVALADPLPTGAPDVPVQVGPPPTGLISQDLKPGTGADVTADETLTVNYIGVSCSTGKIFDSSWSRGKTATFPLSQVIPGWTQGLPGMKVGGERLLGIPADLAYGSSGRPPTIAPDEALWFVVDVVDATATTTTAPVAN